MSQADEKLHQMGLSLPKPASPIANYVPAVRTCNLVFLSGVPPWRSDGSYLTGKVGRELTTQQAYEEARLCALNLLTNLKGEIGDLDRVTHIVKVLGMVNSTPDFGEQPQVINGASDLLVELFGDKGRHARSAVGVIALPWGIAVEIEMVVEVER